MKALRGIVLLVGLAMILAGPAQAMEKQIGMAVEFTSHAACAYVAKHMGWYEEAGLNLTAYESYVTGMALAAALGRGDIQAAYICLVPAITVYANAGVRIKVVAGTHRHGYALVVDPNKISGVADLERPGLRIGCVQEGGAVDIFFRRLVDRYGLDGRKLPSSVQRMNPPKQVLAIKMGRLDAAFLPEHHATMAEALGFKMLVTSEDVWPNMQGSVLVVKDELIRDHPDIVKKLVEVSRKATQWINEHPSEAADIVAAELEVASDGIFPADVAPVVGKLKITPEMMAASMARLAYTTDIEASSVQDVIGYLVELGYIKHRIQAQEILDTRFMK